MALFLHDNRTKALNDFWKEIFISIGISGVSIVVALLFLPSFKVLFRYFVLDLALSVIWFATFALLLILFTKTTCKKALKEFDALATGGACNSQRAAWGFAFLSGGLWLVSFVVGLWAVRREKKDKAKKVEFKPGNISATCMMG